MKDILVISEKYSEYWPHVAAISLILSALFGIAWQLTEDVLWAGYFQLAAFTFFAAGLLSLLKVKDGRVEITATVENEFITTIYKKRDKIIQRDEKILSDIHELEISNMPDKSLYNDLMKSDKCIRFRRKNDDTWYYFNKIESRVIPLSKENAKRLCDFLKQAVNH